jgi:hypothetical protein
VGAAGAQVAGGLLPANNDLAPYSGSYDGDKLIPPEVNVRGWPRKGERQPLHSEWRAPDRLRVAVGHDYRYGAGPRPCELLVQLPAVEAKAMIHVTSVEQAYKIARSMYARRGERWIGRYERGACDLQGNPLSAQAYPADFAAAAVAAFNAGAPGSAPALRYIEISRQNRITDSTRNSISYPGRSPERKNSRHTTRFAT